MDLGALFRTVRRHWLVIVPIVLLTLAGLAFVLVVKAPDFKSTGTIVLISPSPPTDSVGNTLPVTGKTDNPLTRFSDQSVVVDIVARAVSLDSNRLRLAEEGADPRFEVGPTAGPVAEITAQAATSEQAAKTVELVAKSFVDNLATLQSSQGIDPAYSITTLPVEPPTTPQAQVSSTLRSAIGIFVLGFVAAFIGLSAAEARRLAKLRKAGLIDSPDTTPRPIAQPITAQPAPPVQPSTTGSAPAAAGPVPAPIAAEHPSVSNYPPTTQQASSSVPNEDVNQMIGEMLRTRYQDDDGRSGTAQAHEPGQHPTNGAASPNGQPSSVIQSAPVVDR